MASFFNIRKGEPFFEFFVNSHPQSKVGKYKDFVAL